MRGHADTGCQELFSAPLRGALHNHLVRLRIRAPLRLFLDVPWDLGVDWLKRISLSWKRSVTQGKKMCVSYPESYITKYNV